MHVFDFKHKSSEDVPSGTCVLRRKQYQYTVYIKCRVERAFRSSPYILGDAIAVNQDRPIYSRNCGRATLFAEEVHIVEQKVPVRRG